MFYRFSLDNEKDVIQSYFSRELIRMSFKGLWKSLPDFYGMIDSNHFELCNNSYLIFDVVYEYGACDFTNYLKSYSRIVKAGMGLDLPTVYVLILNIGGKSSDKSLKKLRNFNRAARVKEIFLSELDVDKFLETAIMKIKNDITLDDKDMMRLIFAPLTHKDDKKATVEHVNKILDLMLECQTVYHRKIVLTGIAIFCDYYLDNETINRIMDMIWDISILDFLY